MRYFISILTLLLTTQIALSQDYSVTLKIPNTDPILECAGGSSTLGFFVSDDGTNGSNTLYSITSSTPQITLNPLFIELSDTILNGLFNVALLFTYDIATDIDTGTYSIDLTLSCEGCGDPVVMSSFNLEVRQSPDVFVEAFPGTTLCDGSSVLMTANDTSGAMGISYLWSTGSIMPFISTDTASTFWVRMTNACGSSSDTITIIPGTSPTIDSVSCEIAAGQLTNFVKVNDPDSLGLTFQWFENGNPIGDSLDYQIVNTDSTSTLIVTSNDSVSHNLDIYTCEISNTCGSVMSSGCVGILPVELMLFEGNLIDDHVILDWATATEINNDYFEIERSVDANHFNSIAQVKGAGSSNEINNYKYADQSILDLDVNTLYYRIKQVDYDGTPSYSDVIAIDLASGDQRFEVKTVYFEGEQLNIKIFNNKNQNIEFFLYDLRGRKISNFATNILKGDQYITRQLQDLSNGIYVLTVSTEQTQKSVKLFK